MWAVQTERASTTFEQVVGVWYLRPGQRVVRTHSSLAKSAKLPV
jgi:hypothetical protein